MVDEARALGYETHLLPVGRLRQLGRRWSVIRSIARLARERKVSMVFGWMVASQTMAGPAAWLAGVPAAWYQVGLAGPDWLDRLATLFPARGILVLSRDGVTGVLFGAQTADSLVEGVRRADASTWNAGVIRRHAESYSAAQFETRFRAIVEREARR